MIIYGLMKFIEKIPQRYDRMISYLTLGGHVEARAKMLEKCRRGTTVLDIGCGTGSFLIEAADRGALCHGIDASLPMLRVFHEKIRGRPDAERIKTYNQSAALLEKTFAGQKFDLITASLVLGEMPEIVLEEVFRQIPGLLADNGVFLICDELWPASPFRSLLYSILLAITFVPNFILTRTMIRPVKDLEKKLRAAKLEVLSRKDYAWGIVSLLVIRKLK